MWEAQLPHHSLKFSHVSLLIYVGGNRTLGIRKIFNSKNLVLGFGSLHVYHPMYLIIKKILAPTTHNKMVVHEYTLHLIHCINDHHTLLFLLVLSLSPLFFPNKIRVFLMLSSLLFL